MYMDLFWCGVTATLLVEIALAAIAVIAVIICTDDELEDEYYDEEDK